MIASVLINVLLHTRLLIFKTGFMLGISYVKNNIAHIHISVQFLLISDRENTYSRLFSGTKPWLFSCGRQSQRCSAVFVKHFIYLHIVLIHRDLEADLLFESQGQGVGFHILGLQTALQVGVVVALAPSQTVSLFVEPETRHKDEVKSPYGKEEQIYKEG